MRTFRFIISALLISALGAGQALGAAAGKKHAMSVPPVAAPPPPDLGLRGPLDAVKTPPISAFVLKEPPPAGSGAPVVFAAFALPPAPAITPLRSVGDPAPICRAQCAETRYTCATTDDTECDSKWSQCVADCSVPSLR